MKAGAVYQEEEAIANKWRGNDISAGKNQHATIEEVLEAMFCMWSVPRFYNEDQREKLVGGRSRWFWVTLLAAAIQQRIML